MWLNCLEITVAIFSHVAGMLWFTVDGIVAAQCNCMSVH